MTLWNSRKLKLADMNTLVNKFFVRVPENEKEKANCLFSVEREFTAEDVKGQYAFLTAPMAEGDFHAAAEQLTVLNYIRAELA